MRRMYSILIKYTNLPEFTRINDTYFPGNIARYTYVVQYEQPLIWITVELEEEEVTFICLSLSAISTHAIDSTELAASHYYGRDYRAFIKYTLGYQP